MKLAKWIIAVVVLLPATSRANDWTTADTLWQATYTALHVADWAQSLNIADCDQQSIKVNNYTHTWDQCNYVEGNPFLGERPSRGEVNTYFATSLILHTAISYYLPPKHRRVWQAVWIGIEADVVARNARIGVSLSF